MTSAGTSPSSAGFSSAFLAGLSHEFRTPLNGLAGAVSLLEAAGLAAPHKECVDILRQSTEALERVVSDLLDYAHLAADDVTLRLSDFKLQALLDESLRQAEAAAKAKGLELAVERPSEDTALRGDPERLQRVLLLLAHHGVRRSPAGTVGVCAEILGGDAPRLRFVVRERGPAIPPEARNEVFVAFAPGLSLTQGGLGIPLAKKLIAFMQGSLSVEGGPGGETVWTAEIPVDRAAGPDRQAAPPAPSISGQSRRHFAILLAEDSPINQKITLLLLDKLGYRADVAADGREAVAAFRRRLYDLVLMDVEMPEMDGAQATRDIRALEGQRHTPILAVTASSSDEDREKCFAAGMDEYTTKPLTLERLKALMARWDVSLDVESVRGLQELGADSYPSLRDEFLSQSRDQLAKLRTAVTGRDLKAAGGLAHKLKGTSGTFGAVRLQRLNRRVEELAAGSDPDALAPFPDALDEEFARVEALLKAV